MNRRAIAAVVTAVTATVLLAGCTTGDTAPEPVKTVTVAPTPKETVSPTPSPSETQAPAPRSAPAPDSGTGLSASDQAVVDQFRSTFPNDPSTDTDIITVAHQMCQVFDNQGVPTGMQTIYDTSQQTGVSPYAAGYLAGEAVVYYCPEYQQDMLDWIATQPDGGGGA